MLMGADMLTQGWHWVHRWFCRSLLVGCSLFVVPPWIPAEVSYHLAGAAGSSVVPVINPVARRWTTSNCTTNTPLPPPPPTPHTHTCTKPHPSEIPHMSASDMRGFFIPIMCTRVTLYQYGTPWLSDAKIKSYGMVLYTYVVLKHCSFLLKHY